MQPRTDYVKSRDAYIAYQVLGEGPFVSTRGQVLT